MTIATTKIKSFEYNLVVLNEFGIEINLDDILNIEFKQGLSSDINNPL